MLPRLVEMVCGASFSYGIPVEIRTVCSNVRCARVCSSATPTKSGKVSRKMAYVEEWKRPEGEAASSTKTRCKRKVEKKPSFLAQLNACKPQPYLQWLGKRLTNETAQFLTSPPVRRSIFNLTHRPRPNSLQSTTLSRGPPVSQIRQNGRTHASVSIGLLN